MILLAVLACALPGQTIQPAPVTDPKAISSAVAGTAHAAEQQTQQANAVSATMVPTDAIPATPEISVSGTTLVAREDQSSLFTDYKAGIQLVIPAGWMTFRINEEEYLKAFDSEVVLQNPTMLHHLTIIRDHDPKYLRLNAIDVRPGHMPHGILSYINVIFQPEDVRSLENWERAERDRYHPYAGFKFISSSYPQLANGTRVLIIEQSYEAAENKGTIYYRGVFFSLPSGTIVLDLFTDFDFKDTALADVEQVINSLTSVAP
jgi:hypothetical protein